MQRLHNFIEGLEEYYLMDDPSERGYSDRAEFRSLTGAPWTDTEPDMSMEGTDRDPLDISQLEVTNRPAVGFILTGADTDAFVRSLVRATLNGYPCLVTFESDPPPDELEIATNLGATVLGPPQSDDVRPNTLRSLLIGAAKAHSMDGIILVPPGFDVIDYERSVRRLEENTIFSADAVTESESAPQHEPNVLVAIPAFNESETISQVITEAKRYADEVLVVDDGSDDDTASVARDAGAEVLAHERNSGYGYTLKTCFSAALDRGAQTLVILDADGQHDPADIPKLVERLEGSDAEIVIGSRFVHDGDSDLPIYRRLGLKVINVLTNLSMGVIRSRSWVADTQSGFRAYGPAAIESLAHDTSITHRMGASTDILHHAHEHDYGIAEVGTTVSYSVENASSHHPVSHGLTLVSNLLKTIERERPITVFGVPGFLLTLLGFVLGYWSVANYVSTETFPAGIAVAAVFVIIVGLLACFTAIILHSLTVHFDTELTRRNR